MWVGLDQIEREPNSISRNYLPDEVRTNNQRARTPVYKWTNESNDNNKQENSKRTRKLSLQSADNNSNLQMLDLIDVENDNEADESQSHNYKEENGELKKRLEAAQECLVCCEYFIFNFFKN